MSTDSASASGNRSRPEKTPRAGSGTAPLDDYTAAIDTAAVFDVSDRTRLEMTGADAAAFLHRFCTSQLQNLPPGHGCEAFLCNVKGRILGHIFAFAADGCVRIDTAPGQASALMTHLETYHLLEDFRLADITSDTFSFLVSGALAAARLEAVAPQAPELPPGAWLSVSDLAIRRVDLLGVPGFLVDGPADTAERVQQELTDAGIRPAGRDTFTALRIEAGFPEYARDLSTDHLAQEAARTAEAISFNKGCYLGQEPIARLHAMGHVNRQLVCVEIKPAGDDASLPAETTVPSETAAATDHNASAGSAVPAATQVTAVPATARAFPEFALQHPEKPDRQIGQVTSTAWSPGRNSIVGLGMLRSQFATPGTEVPLVPAGIARVFERRRPRT